MRSQDSVNSLPQSEEERLKKFHENEANFLESVPYPSENHNDDNQSILMFMPESARSDVHLPPSASQISAAAASTSKAKGANVGNNQLIA